MNRITSSSNISVKSQTARPKRGVFAWLGRIALWSAAGLITLAAIGAVYQIIGAAMDKRAYPPMGQMVDVGGHQMHLYCTGKNTDGNPTVILETGLGDTTSATWAFVQPEIAKVTHVCSYDRAGMGWSEPGPEPRDAKHIAQELHTLLQNANIHGPYVLVGWSIGGLYAREFAGQYGDETAGLVLLDSTPDQLMSTPEGQKAFESSVRLYSIAPALARLGVIRIMGLLQSDSGLPTPYNEALKASEAATKDWDTQRAEFLAIPETIDQVRNLTLVNDVPLFILSATEHGASSALEEQWQNWQIGLTNLSTNSVQQTVDGAIHDSLWRDPETAKISVMAICKVIEAVHKGMTLK